MAGLIQLKFGVPYFDVYDSRFEGYGIPCAVRGSITFKIDDYREFIALHRLDQFDMEDFRQQIRGALNRIVKACVTNAPDDYGIPLAQIERRITEINDIIEVGIKSNLERDFGVVVKRVDVSEIEIDKSSDGYRQFLSMTQNQDVAAGFRARNAVDAATISEIASERFRASRAEAFNRGPAPVVAKPVSEAPKVQPPRLTPPPIPVLFYFVADGATQTGPFTKNQMAEKVRDGSLTPSTLVWREGMASWEPAETLRDLRDILNTEGSE